MRRIVGRLLVAACLVLLPGCTGGGTQGGGAQGGGDTGSARPAGGAAGTSAAAPDPDRTVYFGWLLGTPDVVAVAFDVEPPDDAGTRLVRAYVCDGLGPPEGLAAWFSGPVDPAATTTGGQTVDLTSAGGREALSIDHLSDRAVGGTFVDATGQRSSFVAYPGTLGAGIYQVTLDEQMHYSGRSTDGSTLSADTDAQGRTRGTVTTAAGETIRFVNQSLALVPLAQLADRGLPTGFPRYARDNQVPGEYVAVISPGATHWLGRSGNVRGGKAGNGIIGLDKAC